MNSNLNQKLRDFIVAELANHADHKPIGNSESIFLSGRLDSFAMVNLLAWLDDTYGVDLSDFEFDATAFDTIDQIKAFVDSKAGA